MKLADEVKQLYESSKLNLVETGVIAEKLGIDDDSIEEKHLQNMFNELTSEVRRVIPASSKRVLKDVLDYIKSVRERRPRARVR